nr:hypothetical protein [uncultured Cohaesibacter sp.]
MTDILIHRSTPSANYTVVRNEIFDAGLGMEALGLLTYLISRPANWKVSQGQLRKQFGIGRDKLLRILKELEGVGYIVRRRLRDPETKSFQKTEFCVYDQPVADEESEPGCETEESAEPRPEKPSPEKPDTAEPDTGKPESANPHLTSNDYIINNYINNPKSQDPPDFSALMTMKPHERAKSMKRWGLTPASFGKTAREMGLNPRALKQKPRAKAKAGTPVPPERQRVFVVQYSPQWEAWVKHRGRAIPTGNYRDPETGRFLTGWWFDTLWPPGWAERS